jgi:hypothetical protein
MTTALCDGCGGAGELVEVRRLNVRATTIAAVPVEDVFRLCAACQTSPPPPAWTPAADGDDLAWLDADAIAQEVAQALANIAARSHIRTCPICRRLAEDASVYDMATWRAIAVQKRSTTEATLMRHIGEWRKLGHPIPKHAWTLAALLHAPS